MQGVTARCRVRRFVPLALLLATTASGQSVFQSRDQLPLTLRSRRPLAFGAPRRDRTRHRSGSTAGLLSAAGWKRRRIAGTTVAAATPFLISHLSRVVCTATDCL